MADSVMKKMKKLRGKRDILNEDIMDYGVGIQRRNGDREVYKEWRVKWAGDSFQ